MNGMSETIRLSPRDNVLVLVRGTNDVPSGHKIAGAPIAKGQTIIKYGHPIGVATQDIAEGAHVHEHNVATRLGSPDENLPKWNSGDKPPHTEAAPIKGQFLGYRRSFGRAGARNDLWVIPTVGCVNGSLRALLRDYRKPDWIDDLKILEHPYGCSQMGEDMQMTMNLLASFALHPNAAGVLIVGLGCEVTQLSLLLDRINEKSGGALSNGKLNIRGLSLQTDGSDNVIPFLNELAAGAPRSREPFPLSELCVGVKCGGSDGYSGLSANPLLGRFANRLVASGGTIIASEIPEMFGAEAVIAARIADEAVFNDFVALIKWFREYFVRHGQVIYENPSPGNRAGGITTLEEKSLGAVEKSGDMTVTHILKYGEAIKPGGGVQIVFGPGNDLVSCASLAASGAQIVLFTTGQGTPYATVVPTLKVSTNSQLAAKHPDWIDFDSGTLLHGEAWDTVTERLTEQVLRVANGERVSHERKGFGEIGIFKDGVIN
ncbi:altronate dehydratase [Synergistales bacterium]|nr:altronate dehydratase [Synergistales bacterium]